jgi:hypothetical protein
MAEYRAYLVGSDGHFVDAVALICDDDSEATEKAKRSVMKGCKPRTRRREPLSGAERDCPQTRLEPTPRISNVVDASFRAIRGPWSCDGRPYNCVDTCDLGDSQRSNDISDPPDLPAGCSRSPDDADTPGLGSRTMRAGKKTPDFRLNDQHGHRVTLSELLLRGAVVLRFCRNENTAICVREFNSLSALHNDVERLEATLVVAAANAT